MRTSHHPVRPTSALPTTTDGPPAAGGSASTMVPAGFSHVVSPVDLPRGAAARQRAHRPRGARRRARPAHEVRHAGVAG
jgi:hypothetical protein